MRPPNSEKVAMERADYLLTVARHVEIYGQCEVHVDHRLDDPRPDWFTEGINIFAQSLAHPGRPIEDFECETLVGELRKLAKGREWDIVEMPWRGRVWLQARPKFWQCPSCCGTGIAPLKLEIDANKLRELASQVVPRCPTCNGLGCKESRVDPFKHTRGNFSEKSGL
jgi:hypothetical protein